MDKEHNPHVCSSAERIARDVSWPRHPSMAPLPRAPHGGGEDAKLTGTPAPAAARSIPLRSLPIARWLILAHTTLMKGCFVQAAASIEEQVAQAESEGGSFWRLRSHPLPWPMERETHPHRNVQLADRFGRLPVGEHSLDGRLVTSSRQNNLPVCSDTRRRLPVALMLHRTSSFKHCLLRVLGLATSDLLWLVLDRAARANHRFSLLPSAHRHLSQDPLDST